MTSCALLVDEALPEVGTLRTYFLWSKLFLIFKVGMIRAREIVGFAGSGPIFES